MPDVGGAVGTAGPCAVLARASRIRSEHQAHSRSGAMVQVELSTTHERQKADRDSGEPRTDAATAGTVQSVIVLVARSILIHAIATNEPITKMETSADA